MTQGVDSINTAVSSGVSVSSLLENLQNEFVGLQRVVPSNAHHYKTLLASKRQGVSRMEVRLIDLESA